MQNIVAIIPARGGSKGIPKKNLINFCGKPLISWTVNQALFTKSISTVWVTSDSEEILNVAKKLGANTISRPKSLSSDTSITESTWKHALKIIEEKTGSVDMVIGLQPTSPIRESKDIEKAIQIFKKSKSDSLFSATEIGDFYIWQKKKQKLTSLNYDYENRGRRQDNTKQYVENGSFYIFKPQTLKKFNNRLGGKIEISLMEFWKSFEIDSFEDLELCETLMKHYILRNKYD
jgi:CMP-N,N'-diacetyllegionaminic acid synthase